MPLSYGSIYCVGSASGGRAHSKTTFLIRLGCRLSSVIRLVIMHTGGPLSGITREPPLQYDRSFGSPFPMHAPLLVLVVCLLLGMRGEARRSRRPGY